MYGEPKGPEPQATHQEQCFFRSLSFSTRSRTYPNNKKGRQFSNEVATYGPQAPHLENPAL